MGHVGTPLAVIRMALVKRKRRWNMEPYPACTGVGCTKWISMNVRSEKTIKVVSPSDNPTITQQPVLPSAPTSFEGLSAKTVSSEKLV